MHFFRKGIHRFHQIRKAIYDLKIKNVTLDWALPTSHLNPQQAVGGVKEKVWERELLKYLRSFTHGPSSTPRDEAEWGFALKWCSCVSCWCCCFLHMPNSIPQKALLISLSLGLGDSAGPLTAPQCMVVVVVDRGVPRNTASLNYSMWSSVDVLAVTWHLRASLWCVALSHACKDVEEVVEERVSPLQPPNDVLLI